MKVNLIVILIVNHAYQITSTTTGQKFLIKHLLVGKGQVELECHSRVVVADKEELAELDHLRDYMVDQVALKGL